MTVQAALQEFYKENGFSEDGGSSQKIAWLKVGKFKVPMYNFKQRREQIWKHDLNHLLTGYGTDWRGEASVSAWEVATGGYGFSPVWLLIISGFMIGVFAYPKETFRAFVRGHFSKSHSILKVRKDGLMNMNLKELRSATDLSETKHIQSRPIHLLKFAFIALVFLSLALVTIYFAISIL